MRYEDLSTDQRIGLMLIYKAGGFDSEAILYLAELDVGFTPKLWKDWLKDELFLEDLEAFQTYSKAFWERMLRENVGNKSFNLPAWYAAVKPKWTEYRDDTPKIAIQNNNITANNERVQSVIDNLMARMSPAQGLTLSVESGENTKVIDVTPEELPR